MKDVVHGTLVDYMHVTYTKASSTGFSCWFYGRTHTGGGSHAEGRWDFGPAGRRTMSFADLGGYSSGTYELYCIIPPGGRLHSYRVDEK